MTGRQGSQTSRQSENRSGGRVHIFRQIGVLLLALAVVGQLFALDVQAVQEDVQTDAEGMEDTEATEDGISVMVYDMELPLGVDPVIREGRVLIPVGALFELLGSEVCLKEETDCVHIGHEFDSPEAIEAFGFQCRRINLTLGEKEAQVGGEEVSLETPPERISDDIFVPLRFVAEQLNFQVDWESETRSVQLTNKRVDDFPEEAPSLLEEDAGNGFHSDDPSLAECEED